MKQPLITLFHMENTYLKNCFKSLFSEYSIL